MITDPRPSCSRIRLLVFVFRLQYLTNSSRWSPKSINPISSGSDERVSGDRVTVSYTKLSEVSLFCSKGMLVLFDELSRKNSEFYPAVIRSVINSLDCNFFVLQIQPACYYERWVWFGEIFLMASRK